MKVMEFTTTEISSDGRNYKIAIPINQILELRTIVGGEQVYLTVNGIPVKESYWETLKLLRKD